MPDLDRFKTAQDHHFAIALAELQAGRKRSHWIWFVFPQLSGLGSSSMSRTYGIHGLAEAESYLRGNVLRERLVTMARVVASSNAPLRDLMGSDVDAQKLVSSMTLFGDIARRLDADEPHSDYARLADDAGTILRAADEQGIPPCVFTRATLNGRRLR